MKIYIAGVGVGMGPLAFIARDIGYQVVCSDLIEHDLVKYMRDNEFLVHIGQDGASIAEEHEKEPIDWFVYTAALPDTHPELTFARNNGIKTSKRDVFINELLDKHDLKMIAVAGTHGKTNTTSMLAWCLMQAGIPISYSIGTRLPFGPFGKYEDGSQYFIYEADEFDRNFLQYEPAMSIVLNIAFDHPDTYADQADYDMAFATFMQQSASVYVYQDDFANEAPNIHAITKNPSEDSTELAGIYIRQNARLVQELLLREFDVPMQDSSEYLRTYPGVSRRMEKLIDGLYTDYAHHPDEIKSALAQALEMNRKVVVVYQPHQNVRQHEILDSYGDCFEGAEQVYWLPTYLSREDTSLDIIEPAQLIEGLSNPAIATQAQLGDELKNHIAEHINNGSIVVGMAAGDLDAWLRKTFVSDESER